jgi:transposase-like protein
MAKSTNPFRYFDSSPEVIRLVVLMYVKYPLSLRNVEDLLAEHGIDICHEAARSPNSADYFRCCRSHQVRCAGCGRKAGSTWRRTVASILRA